MRSVTLICAFLFSVSSVFSQDHVYKAKKIRDISAFTQSPPLRSILPITPIQYEENNEEFDHIQHDVLLDLSKQKPIVSSSPMQLFNNESVVILENFEGVSNVNNLPNPDTEGDVGPYHYMQIVKSSFAIWDKEGELLYGPADNKTLWNALPGPWHDLNWTDPIVLYDPIADRWLASAMVYDLYVEYFEMIAVSATPDPLGSWNCYALHFDNMPDYPKFGVWPDGYYLTINEYELAPGITHFDGAGILVFNRDELIAGVSDPMILYFKLDAPNQSFLSDPASFLPADLDGPPPLQGTPNYFTSIRDDAWGYDFDHIWLWECIIDWEDTSNCVFQEVTKLKTEGFDARWDMGSGWIHQPYTNTKLHGLGQFMMYRLQYRNFGEYQSMMCNHTINNGDDQAALRWYELRNDGVDWYIYQQGTHAPDNESRWMGSIAMDKDGNIGIGYSVSSDTTYPSIRISGKNFSDPPGMMTFPEAEVIAGNGNQVMNVRWGDYSMLAVDPADDLTFWYTQEYLPSTAWNSWRTRIASFQLHKNLTAMPDSLVFMTYDECAEGKTLSLKNNSSYPVTITDIEQLGYFSSATWYIDPWNITLPKSLQPGDSLNLTIIVEFPVDYYTSFVSDSLEIVTDYTIHQFPIFLNEDLLVHDPEITNLMKPFSIQVQPNPFRKQTEIILDLQEKGMAEIALFDLNLVKVEIILKPALLNSGTYKFNCGAGLPGGTYVLKVRFSDRVIAKRLMKI